MATLPLEETQKDVASVFLSYFNRAPEFDAMNHYVDLYNQPLDQQGDDPAAEPNAFKALAAQIYLDGTGAGEVPDGATITNSIYVTYLYQNILGRAPDDEGQAYWTSQLDSGAIDRAELVAYFLDAAEASERDNAYLQNRLDVSLEFARWENSNPNVLDTLEYNAAEVLQGVNEDPASVDVGMGRLYETRRALAISFL